MCYKTEVAIPECLWEYSNKHGILFSNITAAAKEISSTFLTCGYWKMKLDVDTKHLEKMNDDI